jgi:hypothetical protein
MNCYEKVVKVGFLKQDLYDFKPKHGIDAFWLSTTTKRDQLIENFKNAFKMVMDKGTKFECFKVNGQERWYDSLNYGIMDMDEKWAAEYLENIQSV